MTEKAQRILDKMKNRRAKKPRVDKVLQEFNQSTLDDVGPVGGQKGEKFLAELNELQEFENDNWSRGEFMI